ncbi:MAG TPA: sugar ABC transporter permease [Thermotogota bacterium]|nr:MAG: Inner membrane ABC transporter permease protein YcjO [Thermotogota bacterium ADurb.Bin062]HOD90882.1 sugar ABC transporter permease [Thermotogota bacterium]HOF23533.1 sugar ABC transporter permease [Thermotogota bacterium]HOS24829.1 sugar ABC transporter permease [Thermotogota bacterium]HOT86166.1 sugar ABC transporter permease [Thermotogota bacterium]
MPGSKQKKGAQAPFSSPEMRPHHSLKKKSRRFFFLLALFIPTFSVIGFLTIYPTIRGFILSFQNYTVFNIRRIRYIGLQNYERVLQSGDFGLILWNTFVWIFFSVLFQMLLGLGLALLMRKPFKGRGIYAGFVFYPWALSGFAIGLIWRWLFDGSFGIINDILIRLGIIERGISFFSDPVLAMVAVITVNIWYGFPFFAIMILAALQGIPQDVYESAWMDGANPINTFFKVTLPFIRPVLINTVLLRVIWVMNYPDIIYAMTRGGPAKATEILSVYMINIVFYENNNFSKASAVGVIIISILMVFTTFTYLVTNTKRMEL